MNIYIYIYMYLQYVSDLKKLQQQFLQRMIFVHSETSPFIVPVTVLMEVLQSDQPRWVEGTEFSSPKFLRFFYCFWKCITNRESIGNIYIYTYIYIHNMYNCV